MNGFHIPVMLEEVVKNLDIKSGNIYLDGTIGGGGHAALALETVGKKGKIIGIDQDIDAINFCHERFKDFDNVILVRDNFCKAKDVLAALKMCKVNNILLDLGVSSWQIDTKIRGFSYKHDSPLDMRMDTRLELSAYHVINHYEEQELARIFEQYGEEVFAERIARHLAISRLSAPVLTTGELVRLVENAIPARVRYSRKGHPAKKVFQAVRIEVNGELDKLSESICNLVECLETGGRMCVLTFHSLEDRCVKSTFAKLSQNCSCPHWFPVCSCDSKAVIKTITRKPLIPSEEECLLNPRSRSAKLRVVEKLFES